MLRLESGEHDPVGILVTDVDGLKYINVTMGNETGNEVLLTAVRIVQAAFDDAPFIARIGGDEFAVLIPRCEKKVLENGAERIRAAVRRFTEEHPEIPLNISLGLAINSDSGATVRELLTEADNHMSREKTLSNKSIHSSVVSTLRKALEARDFITEGHASRVQELCERLGRVLGLPERSLIDLRLMAQFHDIGKVGIPDRILMKPGSLTPEEAIDMQRHCEIGYRVALAATDLVPIADWILKHHEWWNGQGYPQGLKGDKIPLECRIMAVVDAYDVMTNDRPYRRAVSHAEAMEEIKRYAGIQFDPFVVKKLEELFKESRQGN
jgi:diguanylate cyclase (GGDEF)-like protein